LRLSLELFIVPYILKEDFTISMAGTFFLIYSICDIISGSIFLWFPSLFLGSRARALFFFFSTVGSQIAGFILFFVSRNVILMGLSIGLCGLGTSSWFVNYQILINFAFPRDELKKAASFRQMFEALGFLLPSLSLLIIYSVVPENLIDNVFSITAIVLGTTAFLFYFASFADVVKLATQSTNEEISSPNTHGSKDFFEDDGDNTQLGVWESTKFFFKSSVLRFTLFLPQLNSTSNE